MYITISGFQIIAVLNNIKHPTVCERDMKKRIVQLYSLNVLTSTTG